MLVSLMFKFFHKDVCVELPVFLSCVMSIRYCHHGSLLFFSEQLHKPCVRTELTSVSIIYYICETFLDSMGL